jgi:hypothetical protein
LVSFQAHAEEQSTGAESMSKATEANNNDQYSVPHDFLSAVSLLQSLIATRNLVKSTLQARAVITSFDLVGNSARAAEGNERLQAVSILGKAAEISKPAAAVATPLLKTSLLTPLPPIGSWGTADDRYYLAKGVSAGVEPWISSYAAIELGRGDITERKSRSVWAEIAINRAESLAAAVDILAQALADDRRTSNFTVDTASRKLNRIAVALQELLPAADIPTGEGFGKAFSGLVIEAVGRNGPETRTLRQETAQNILDLMIHTLRLRFSASLDSDIYRAAGAVLGWWKPARPPDAINSRAERIARIAMDSLHTLARQGVMQQNLRQALVTSFGAEIVDRIGAALTEKDPSLDPSIASWLSRGRALDEVRSNLAVREVNEQELDELVARLLLAVDNQEGGPQSLELIAGDIELLEPRHTSTIRSAVNRARLFAQWAQAIGTRRRLALSGKRGDLVQYDPAIHDTSDNLQMSARARIQLPGVTKQQEGRPPRIILKAQVEKP